MDEQSTIAIYKEAEKLFATMIADEEDAAFYFAYPDVVDELVRRLTSIDSIFCHGVYDEIFGMEDYTLELNANYSAGRRVGKRLQRASVTPRNAGRKADRAAC